MSCFKGKMREYRNVSIDRFDADNLKSTAFFLSHIHEDHTVGLKDAAFFEYLQSRNDVFLYCSEVTKLLLLTKSKYSHLDQYVRVLPVDQPSNVSIPQQGSCKIETVEVTLLHAAHCPGSVMFLFDGSDGVCLYTGDFRWDNQRINTIKALHNDDNSIKQIDSLYIDTTFCHESSIYIPSREDSANAVSTLVSEWIAKGDNYVVHFTPRAQYGHEHLLKEIYLRTGHKVHVFDEKYEIYKKIPGLEDVFTDDGSSTPVHACKGKWCSTSVPCGKQPEDCRVMVILPSTMYFTMINNYDLGHIVIKNGIVHRVCYSFHSSYTEVKDFVTYLQPKIVRPNVKPAQDKNILKVQGRLNEFLNLKNSKAIIDSQKVKPLGRLRRSKFRRRTVSENSSESIDLNFGTQEEYIPSPKRAKVKVHNDIEDVHSSYDGSVRSDNELSDVCDKSDQETDVQSRPQSLSLPGQSLLAALDEQEFLLTQGSQPEILDGRVCLPDDEEQISAVVVQTNALQSVEYDMIEGDICTRGENHDRKVENLEASSGCDPGEQRDNDLDSTKVKCCETLSSSGDSLITTVEEAEIEILYSNRIAAQLKFKNNSDLKQNVKNEEDMDAHGNKGMNFNPTEAVEDGHISRNTMESLNSVDDNDENGDVGDKQLLGIDHQCKPPGSEDKTLSGNVEQHKSELFENKETECSETSGEDIIMIDSSCSTVCESVQFEVNIDLDEDEINETHALKSEQERKNRKETSCSNITSNTKHKVEDQSQKIEKLSTEGHIVDNDEVILVSSGSNEVHVQKMEEVAKRQDQSLEKKGKSKKNGSEHYDLFGSDDDDDDDNVENKDNDVTISDVTYSHVGNEDSHVKNMDSLVVRNDGSDYLSMTWQSYGKVVKTAKALCTKVLHDDVANVKCARRPTTRSISTCERKIDNSFIVCTPPDASQSMCMEFPNDQLNYNLFIFDSDDEEETSLLSGKKSLSRRSSFTNKEYLNENEESNSKTLNDSLNEEDFIKILKSGQYIPDSDDETMSPITTPVKVKSHKRSRSHKAVGSKIKKLKLSKTSRSCERLESSASGLIGSLRPNPKKVKRLKLCNTSSLCRMSKSSSPGLNISSSFGSNKKKEKLLKLCKTARSSGRSGSSGLNCRLRPNIKKAKRLKLCKISRSCRRSKPSSSGLNSTLGSNPSSLRSLGKKPSLKNGSICGYLSPVKKQTQARNPDLQPDMFMITNSDEVNMEDDTTESSFIDLTASDESSVEIELVDDSVSVSLNDTTQNYVVID